MNDFKATVIIPAYNEGEAIGSLLQAIQDGGYTDKYEFVVIDDGSTDNTGQVIAQYPVKLATHLTNKGYGAALKTGIRMTTTEKVIIMDSDGQHSPEYLDKIAALLDTYPMVIGERDSTSHQVANRQLGKKIIRLVGEFLVEQKLPDYNSGFRGFQREKIAGMLSIMPNGFSFSTTSTLSFLKHGYDIATLPITVSERVGRKSNVKFIKDGTKTLLLIFRIIMLFNPMKIFLPLSVCCGALGAGWTFLGIVTRFKIPNGGVLLLVFSLLLFMIGLVSDQVSMLNLRENKDA